MDSHSRRHQSLGIYGLKLISLRDLSCLTFFGVGCISLELRMSDSRDLCWLC